MDLSGQPAQKRDNLPVDFLRVSHQKMATGRKAQKSSVRDEFCGVGRASEGSIQVVLGTDQKGGDADSLQVVARKCRDEFSHRPIPSATVQPCR